METLQANVDSLNTATNILWFPLGRLFGLFYASRLCDGGVWFHACQNCCPHDDDEHDGLLRRCDRLLDLWFCLSVWRRQHYLSSHDSSAFATQSTPEWAFSPVTLGAWGDLLSHGLHIGQWGLLGLQGFFLQGVPNQRSRNLCLFSLPDGLHGYCSHDSHWLRR